MGLFGALFWGVFLLAAGVILLLKYIFNLQVSAGKLIFGLFVLLVGISLLAGSFGWRNVNFSDANTAVFNSGQRVSTSDGQDYSVVFGSVDYDLTTLEPGSHVTINVAFSSATVKLPEAPIQVNATSAFGSVHLPDGSDIVFGDRTYETDGENKVTVDVHSAFGSVSISE